jgi:rare lipoprotein A
LIATPANATGSRRFSDSTRFAAYTLVFAACGLLTFGCAAHNPSASANKQPAPSQPSSTPESAAEAAKRDTDYPGTAAANPAARPGKRAPATPVAAGYIEEGNASWYGVPFNGRRSSNGETYDMYKLTAAHRTLPFDTMVRVTNLNNGKFAVVRITDRGPFVGNRIIDLSFAAAQQIESIGPGVVPIKLEVISGTADLTAGFFTVQVGAFRDRDNAERLREKLNASSYSPVYIQPYEAPEGTFYRVRVGKISGQDAAQQYASRLQAHDGFSAFVVRLDESGAGKDSGAKE